MYGRCGIQAKKGVNILTLLDKTRINQSYPINYKYEGIVKLIAEIVSPENCVRDYMLVSKGHKNNNSLCPLPVEKNFLSIERECFGWAGEILGIDPDHIEETWRGRVKDLVGEDIGIVL